METLRPASGCRQLWQPQPVFLLASLLPSVVALRRRPVCAVHSCLNQAVRTRVSPFLISAAFRSPQSLEERPSRAAQWGGFSFVGCCTSLQGRACVGRSSLPGSSRPSLSLPVSTCVPCTSTCLPFLLCEQDRLYQFCSDCNNICINPLYFSFSFWLGFTLYEYVHKYNGILLNYESNVNWVICRDVGPT